MGFYSDFIGQCEKLGDPESVASLMRVRSQLVGITPPGLHLAFPIPADTPPKIREAVAREAMYFVQTAVMMKRARIVRLLGAQAQVFLETPGVEGQDYVNWLRLPYQELYVQLDPPIVFGGYASEYDPKMEAGAGTVPGAILDPPGSWDNIVDVEELARRFRTRAKGDPIVKGVLLVECPGSKIKRLGFRAREFLEWYISDESAMQSDPVGDPLKPGSGNLKVEIDMTQCERVLQVCFLIPLPDYFLNTHIATLAIMKDGRLLCSKQGLWQTRKRMIDWAIHLINFLSSPSVKLVPAEHEPALQKARARRGKPPLPGWYEITYRKHIKEYTKDKFSTRRWEHSFRYDVRGHFARYTRGPMAGRVIWVPPHQRGVKHALYKPKTYRSGEPVLDSPTEVWKG